MFSVPTVLLKVPRRQWQYFDLRYCGLLPRDLVHEGRTFTQLFRSHGKGGKVVMLENSLPGRASGHHFVVFKIDVENGREQLGEEIASPNTLDRAIDIASQPSGKPFL